MQICESITFNLGTREFVIQKKKREKNPEYSNSEHYLLVATFQPYNLFIVFILVPRKGSHAPSLASNSSSFAHITLKAKSIKPIECALTLRDTDNIAHISFGKWSMVGNEKYDISLTPRIYLFSATIKYTQRTQRINIIYGWYIRAAKKKTSKPFPIQTKRNETRDISVSEFSIYFLSGHAANIWFGFLRFSDFEKC